MFAQPHILYSVANIPRAISTVGKRRANDMVTLYHGYLVGSLHVMPLHAVPYMSPATHTKYKTSHMTITLLTTVKASRSAMTAVRSVRTLSRAASAPACALCRMPRRWFPSNTPRDCSLPSSSVLYVEKCYTIINAARPPNV